MRLLRSISAVVIAALLAIGTAGALPASAAQASSPSRDPGLPAGFGSWDAVFKVQNPLNSAGFDIQDAAQANPQSGYTNFSLDLNTKSITLYWHGQPDSAESGVINSVRARGIRVHLVAAAHSQRQLQAQAAAIALDANAATGPRILRITTATDGSGIQVGVASSTTVAANASRLMSGLPHLQAAVAQGDVVVVAQTPTTSQYLREADLPQFWGGALLIGNGDACSSGFAANWPAVNKDYIITAAHCGPIGSTWHSGAGTLIGTAEGHTPAYDALFINTAPTGGSQGRVYDGPGVYRSGQFSKPVKGAGHVGNRGFVCLSGALTGAVCNTQVTNTTDSDCSDPSLGCVHLIDAVSRGNALIAGEGDSGGPVFTLTGDSSGDIAVGLIHGPIPNTALTDCPDPLAGHIPGAQTRRLCSTNVSFTDVLNAMAPFNGLQISTN